METKHWLIIYAVTAAVFETIYFFFLWKKFKNKMDTNPQFQMIKGMVLSFKSAQSLKKKIWNPITIVFFVVPIFIIISQIIFPLTIISLLKKLIFGKSKLDKEAEAEQMAMGQSFSQAKDFLKNEGRFDVTVEETDFNLNIDLNIDKNE